VLKGIFHKGDKQHGHDVGIGDPAGLIKRYDNFFFSITEFVESDTFL
jgi:hypothetical protein